MGLIYVHLSDIHFGQEKGGNVYVNNDVKEQLIIDVRTELRKFDGGSANGIIISGDIAYAGKAIEYKNAGDWIDRLTSAAGCNRTEVQVVPGNHDIDRTHLSAGAQKLIDDILENGDDALDRYLENEDDREVIYKRFADYRVFAEAYNCPLDVLGSILGTHRFEIAPNRYIKFHGINTALICSKSPEEGSLLLGKRQRVIPVEENVEIVVIAHHPLHWLQDSEDALRYISNRSRVFISGHEHSPSCHCKPVGKNEDMDLLSIAAGATVPPDTNDIYTYCYNILEFSWDEHSELLIVKVFPRMWVDELKAFDQDTKHFNEYPCTFRLKGPNSKVLDTNEKKVVTESPELREKVETGKPEILNKSIVESNPDIKDEILLLRFFRELTGAQRIKILVELDALPEGEDVTHSTESEALKELFSNGKSKELDTAIQNILSLKIDDNNHD